MKKIKKNSCVRIEKTEIFADWFEWKNARNG